MKYQTIFKSNVLVEARAVVLYLVAAFDGKLDTLQL